MKLGNFGQNFVDVSAVTLMDGCAHREDFSGGLVVLIVWWMQLEMPNKLKNDIGVFDEIELAYSCLVFQH